MSQEEHQGLKGDPLWYKDAVIYQTHIKAFFDTDGDGIGDLRGLTEKLDYIGHLGANAIWLLPFYPSPMRDDGYDIADYRGIHPPYGTRRDFRRFVNEAHRRGIRVIIELIINHTSDQHPWFQAARRAPKGSMKRDYYVWSDDDRRFPETRIIFTDYESSNWAWDPVAQQYYWHRFFSHQPDLNHNNPQVVAAVIRVMRFWLDMGVDGLRLDAIPYLCVRDGTNNENLPETHAVIKQMRAVVDAHYQDRMFLAEANQWPEDVRDYFGDGDECHVAYHFPLMPRMYMAVAQEDRHPIVEIMEQTPAIPANCQWAVFLRNHDELTLEMVSDRERDYMYRIYAADPRMRLNAGIRRRLASLLDNDRDKIRLMHSLLLSMPGCPILYYGDELGMGDNIYLGDRNGVRTPMQWSPDRNAGFSRADPQRLYLPPIMDPIFGYAAINVEAQRRDAASLLNWMRRIIDVRKTYPVFARGSLSFLDPGNRKILAYVRGGTAIEGQDKEAVLCVANLARSAQPVELDLARFQGRVPIELLGQTPFPPIGDLPYLLTLPGHGFYWFLLSTKSEPPTWHEEYLSAIKLATLVIPEGWESLQPRKAERQAPMERARALLSEELLPAFLTTRRWYTAKESRIRSVTFREVQQWQDWLLALVRVELDTDAQQDYFLPLSIQWDSREDDAPMGAKAAALARVRRQANTGLLYDALADDGFVGSLATDIGKGGELPLADGRLLFSPVGDPGDWLPVGGVASVRIPAEGSNSAAILDDRLFLKAYRRLRAGINPEVEIGRFLTEVSPFAHVVPLVGSLEYQTAEGACLSLAMLQRYVPNQGDLWAHTLNSLERLGAEYGERSADWDTDPAQIAYSALTDTLGRRIAELHRALAAPGGGDAFDPEPMSDADLAALRERIQQEGRTTLERLQRRLGDLQPETQAQAKALLDQADVLAARVGGLVPDGLQASKMRCHGDLHLGQVLVVENDVVVIDFEGEPARPLEERRAKQSPLIDVAGLVRSFHYAGASALARLSQGHSEERARLSSAVAHWTRAMTSRMLAAYEEAAAGSPGFPVSGTQARELIQLLVLQKALYEIRYEMDNRPDWVGIPVDGVLGLLT